MLPFLTIGMLAVLAIYAISAVIPQPVWTLVDNVPEFSRRMLHASHLNETCDDTVLSEFDRGSRGGAIFLYSLIALYCFLGLAILCDDFFTESLEVICEQLKLSEDVAGATFMAAGGSAPELFTSLLTVLTSQNSAGVGTILGSAVFNLVVIISLSALVTDGLTVDYRPIIRDSVAYAIAIITMTVFALTPISSEDPELDGKGGFGCADQFIPLLSTCSAVLTHTMIAIAIGRD
jgi:hypothetical protein